MLLPGHCLKPGVAGSRQDQDYLHTGAPSHVCMNDGREICDRYTYARCLGKDVSIAGASQIRKARTFHMEYKQNRYHSGRIY